MKKTVILEFSNDQSVELSVTPENKVKISTSEDLTLSAKELSDLNTEIRLFKEYLNLDISKND